MEMYEKLESLAKELKRLNLEKRYFKLKEDSDEEIEMAKKINEISDCIEKIENVINNC